MVVMTIDQRVELVRRFNRFYSQQIGALDEGHLRSPYSLVETRVLYELAHREIATASELGRDLGLDPGYLSRILRNFENSGLLAKTPSKTDGRQSHLRLTEKGKETFAPLNERAHSEISAMIGKLSASEQQRLIEAMTTILRLLGAPGGKNDGHGAQLQYILRHQQPGDMGWIVSRHGALYAKEHGYDDNFEALVSEITAHFIRNFNPKFERCWIAERDGENIGSVMLVKESETVAKLRLLLVEPKARGLGIGARLVDECIRFAQQVGYRKITLWTQSTLSSATKIYEKAGFQLVKEEEHNVCGPKLIGQTWELALPTSQHRQ